MLSDRIIDKLGCAELYRQAFHDNDIPFETALFESCFEYCRYIKENGKIISMLFALPCEVKTKLCKEKCIYIYAAATLKEYRGCGYMGRLLENIKADNIPIFLRPANEGLIAFYRKFGFKTAYAQKLKALPYIAPIDGFKSLTEKFPKTENGEQYTAMYYGEKMPDKINFIYTME